MIFAITGGSGHEFPSKRQRREYLRQVNHVAAYPPVGVTRWIDTLISFSAADLRPMIFPHDDAFVMAVNINGFDVRKVLLDRGSSADVILWSTLEKMGYGRSDL
ncbi:hypothetical protein QOZ80_7BG0591300 [Eleusine coracana subsp. coracana]|nr:hypothetical protein QOZ80_7BG0591300 [Eleusine coracana subsp. coracana]